MNIATPTAEQVRAALAHLTLKQIDVLAVLSGVAAPTIYKIKNGHTKNPGIDTCGKLLPYVDAARKSTATQGA